jgi:hypothetical protein
LVATCASASNEQRSVRSRRAPAGCELIDLEGRDAAESLRQAALDRRYGTRTMNFNCFDVVIDGDTGTVTLEDAINLDGQRAVIPLGAVVRDLSS